MADPSAPVKLTAAQLSILRTYRPGDYCIAWGLDPDAKRLEALKLLEWIPPVFGGINYGITPAGRAALNAEEE